MASVRLSAGLLKKLWMEFDVILWTVDRGQEEDLIRYCGGNPESFVDFGSVSKISLPLGDRMLTNILQCISPKL